jgi:hypothetical protein
LNFQNFTILIDKLKFYRTIVKGASKNGNFEFLVFSN